MLKGVCEIELRDENGNVVQKTKDKNMVTDAINRLLNPDIQMIKLQFAMSTPELKEYFSNKLPILDRLIGGILLFNETQEENIDNIMYDVGNIVGSGSVMIETMPDDNRIGVFNKEESAVIKNDNGKDIGIKFVWDFATNQANGTIRSVSLTSGISAKGLYKNDELIVYMNEGLNNLHPLKYLNGQNVTEAHNSTPSTMTGCNCAFLMQIKEDEFIVVTDTEISRVKCRKNLGLTESLNGLSPTGSDKIIGISNDSWFNGKTPDVINPYFTDYRNNLYFCKIENRILTVNKYDTETLEVSSKNIDLSNVISNNSRYPVTIYENYYVVVGYNGSYELKFIEMNDYTLKKVVSVSGMSSVSFGIYNDNLFVSSSSMNSTSSSLNQKSYLIDKNLNIIKMGAKIQRGIASIKNDFIKAPFFMFRNIYTGGTSVDRLYHYGIAINPHIKFTIDNLATPVTKTASQTMKVIYTIQDAPEE